MHPELPPTTTSSSSTPRPEASQRVRRACLRTRSDAAAVPDGLLRVARVAAEHGVELILPAEELAKHPVKGIPCQWREGEGEDADLVVVLGGDGTTLRALARSIDTGVPVLAVNHGRVGFLTTAEESELEVALARGFAGEFRVRELPTIAVARGGRRLGLAINDAVVTSDLHGRMAGFRWSVQGVALGEIGCDAMVLSTPTGSTAYNLSAGGPVVAWGLEAISVTFVAPHSLRVRSLVLPRGVEVEIENVSEAGDARVILDGHLEHRALARGERVTVQIADETARLALLPEVAFLQRYRDTFAT